MLLDSRKAPDERIDMLPHHIQLAESMVMSPSHRRGGSIATGRYPCREATDIVVRVKLDPMILPSQVQK